MRDIHRYRANPQRTNFMLMDARFYNKTLPAKGLRERACIAYVSEQFIQMIRQKRSFLEKCLLLFLPLLFLMNL